MAQQELIVGDACFNIIVLLFIVCRRPAAAAQQETIVLDSDEEVSSPAKKPRRLRLAAPAVGMTPRPAAAAMQRHKATVAAGKLLHEMSAHHARQPY